MKQRILKVHPKDNVLVALTDLVKGEEVIYEGESYLLTDNVPAKHKFTTADLAAGDKVIIAGLLPHS